MMFTQKMRNLVLHIPVNVIVTGSRFLIICVQLRLISHHVTHLGSKKDCSDT